MTSTVNQFTHSTVMNTSYDVVSLSLGGITIVVLFLFLVEKEMIRTFVRAWGRRSQQGLNMAVLPLLVAFFTIVVVRLAVTVFHRHWS
jgi:hypothetical protein